MSMEAEKNQEFDPSFVRDQLDEILAHEITNLLDVDSGLAMMSFNLASISCITLMMERENEIKQFADSPPERYTRASFVDELQDIGLEKDENLDKAVDNVIGKGYVSIGSGGELKAEMPAFMMSGFLDNMFPGMQGMNLVAFIMQMNDEVNSGRKSLELAKDSFKSTLKSRGVSVSADTAKQKADQIASGKVSTPPARSKEISRELKKANLQRLSKMVSKRKKSISESAAKAKIQDISFDQGPSQEEMEARKAEMQKAEEAAKRAAELARKLAEKDEEVAEAQEMARKAARQLEELQEKEKQLAELQKEAEKNAEKAAVLDEREAQMAEKEAQLRALEEKLKLDEEMKLQRAEAERKKQLELEAQEKASRSDDDIESQIAAFESDLKMPCPMCKDGQIESKTTEKGKEFFSCTNKDCRFVSWDKPYHFECPLCKNSYLTETVSPGGNKGLKCPRASCPYTQDNLFDPKLSMAKSAESSAPKKKKKRVVRRIKR